MKSHNESNKMKIFELEKRMEILSVKITDSQFKENPLARMSSIQKQIIEKNKEKENLIKEMNSLQVDLDAHQETFRILQAKVLRTKNSLVDFDKAKREMDKVMKDIERTSMLMNDLMAEEERITNEVRCLLDTLDYFRVNETYGEYQAVYLKKFNIEREMGISNEEVAKEMLAINRMSKNGQYSLIEIYANIIKNQKSIIDNFCQRLGFELSSKHLDGITEIEFKSTNAGENFSLTISDDDIGATEPITENNMRRIIPAMIALFLQGIKEDDSSGCEFTPRSEAAQKYFEDIFSKELVKLGGRFENFRINGKAACEVVAENKSAIGRVETESADHFSMRHR